MRDAVRDAWLTPANARPDVVARFFVAAADGEEADAVRAEARHYGDIVLLGDEEEGEQEQEEEEEEQETAQQAQQTAQREPMPAATAPAPESGEARGPSAAAAGRKGGRRLAARSRSGSRK